MEFTRNHLLDQNFGMCITTEDLILPYYSSIGSNYYRPWKWCIDSGIRDFGSSINDQKEKFNITLDVQHFRPNEISVKVVDKEIIVEGKHDERQDNHGIISRQFKRRYVLPSDCLPELVSSTLSSDGLLTVTAGKQSFKNKDTEITVPIQMCGPSLKKEQAENKKGIDCKVEDIINNNIELENNASTTSKVESSSMKTGLTEASKMLTEKMLMEARKESNNLTKTASDMVQIDAGAALATKMENVADYQSNQTIQSKSDSESKSNVSMEELVQKVSEKNVVNMIETSNFNSMMRETVASEQSSSFQSSITSSMKVSDEQINEFISDVISAELKEAAEII